MNLLKETIEFLKENGKCESDVLWVGTKLEYISWLLFKKYANCEYDNGFGGAEVNQGLIVAGKDFWLERYEYDGSECWVFKETPIMPDRVGDEELLFQKYD